MRRKAQILALRAGLAFLVVFSLLVERSGPASAERSHWDVFDFDAAEVRGEVVFRPVAWEPVISRFSLKVPGSVAGPDVTPYPERLRNLPRIRHLWRGLKAATDPGLPAPLLPGSPIPSSGWRFVDGGRSVEEQRSISHFQIYNNDRDTWVAVNVDQDLRVALDLELLLPLDPATRARVLAEDGAILSWVEVTAREVAPIPDKANSWSQVLGGALRPLDAKAPVEQRWDFIPPSRGGRSWREQTARQFESEKFVVTKPGVYEFRASAKMVVQLTPSGPRVYKTVTCAFRALVLPEAWSSRTRWRRHLGPKRKGGMR